MDADAKGKVAVGKINVGALRTIPSVFQKYAVIVLGRMSKEKLIGVAIMKNQSTIVSAQWLDNLLSKAQV